MAQGQSILEKHLLTGTCRTDLTIEWPILCVRAQGGMALHKASRTKIPAQNRREFTYGKGYMGLHLNKILSGHGKATTTKTTVLTTPAGSTIEKHADHFYLHAGNIVATRVRLSLGKITLPFGIQSQQTMESLNKLTKSEAYWPSPELGLKLSYTDLVSGQIDISVSRPNLSERNENKSQYGTYSLRAIKDLSALSGTRLTLSMFSTETEQRLGFGLLNNSPEGSLIFEWIRISETGKIKDYPSNQLLQISYAQNFKFNKRWIFEYQEELNKHWLTTLGYDLIFMGLFQVRNAVSYFKSQTELQHNHWILNSGIRVDL